MKALGYSRCQIWACLVIKSAGNLSIYGRIRWNLQFLRVYISLAIIYNFLENKVFGCSPGQKWAVKLAIKGM